MKNVTQKTTPRWRDLTMKKVHDKVWDWAFSVAGLVALVVVFCVGVYYMLVVSPLAPTQSIVELEGGGSGLVTKWGEDGNIFRAILCVVIAFLLAVAEGGAMRLANQRKRGKTFLRLIGVCGLIGGIFVAVEIQMHHTREAIARQEANREVSDVMFGQVASITDLAAEEQAVQAAEATVTRANEEYQRALSWRDTALACPDTGVCAAIIPIQRALGVRDDGVVRSAAGACANCGETMEAILAEVDATRERLQTAEDRRDTAAAVLREEQEGIRDGNASQVAEKALMTRLAENRLDSLEGIARFFVGPPPEPSEELAGEAYGEAMLEHEENVDDMLLRIAMVVSFFFAMFPNGANFGFGNFGHDDDKPEDDEPDTLEGTFKAIPHTPDAPGDGAQVIIGADGKVIQDDAPYNPHHESRDAAHERLKRAEERLAAVRGGRSSESMTDEEARLKEAIAEAEERRQHNAKMAALRRQLAELTEDEALDIPRQGRADYEETTRTVRRTATRSPMSPEEMDDLERRLEEFRAFDAPTPRPEPEVAEAVSDDELRRKIAEHDEKQSSLRDLYITIQNGDRSETTRQRAEDLKGQVHVLRNDILVEDKRRRHTARRYRAVPLNAKD